MSVNQYVFVGKKIHPNYDAPQLINRNYVGSLLKMASEICLKSIKEISEKDLKECRHITGVPLDCILRNRVRKYGDFINPLRTCKYELEQSKEELNQKYSNRILMDIFNKEIEDISSKRMLLQ